MEQPNTIYPPFTIGVGLGGTNTAFAVVDSVGHILAKDSIPTKTPTIEIPADNLADRISDMIHATDLDGHIEGIGIGAPCANAVTGCIEAATNLPGSPHPPCQHDGKPPGSSHRNLQRRQCRRNRGNDLRCSRRTEEFHRPYAWHERRGGIVCDGHLLSGTRGFAGELGHVTFPFAADRLCSCGRYGCLHTIASADGIRMTTKNSSRNLTNHRYCAKSRKRR